MSKCLRNSVAGKIKKFLRYFLYGYIVKLFMEKKYLRLNDIQAYKTSFNLSNYVWSIVLTWDYFARDTIGKQFTRAIDSTSANIAEGFGHYGKRDKINFY